MKAVVSDYYTHLDTESGEPVADLRVPMKVSGVEHALVVAMWNGDDREAMRGLRALGPERLVTGTDYPYLDKPRYGAYLAFARDLIRRQWPFWSDPDVFPR